MPPRFLPKKSERFFGTRLHREWLSREGWQDPAAISFSKLFEHSIPTSFASRWRSATFSGVSAYQELQHLVDVTIDRISSFRKRTINLLTEIKRVLSEQCGIPDANIWFQQPRGRR